MFLSGILKMVHTFKSSIEGILLPDKFTYPFCYTPHPLCVMAAKEVQDYLSLQKQWAEELGEGKMFGTLVVRTVTGCVGYLAAFSGNLAHSNKHDFFVPPVFDLLNPEGFFVEEERTISKINEDIENLCKDRIYTDLKKQLEDFISLSGQRVEEAKTAMMLAKAERDKQRKLNPDEEELSAMVRDSQFGKAEFKRLKQKVHEDTMLMQNQLMRYENEINALKEERKNRSLILQRKLFDSFRVLNAKGEEQGLYDIFMDSVGKLPPAGAGECAAPKLLQYAYKHGMHPLAMAEFWWKGADGGLRRHGYFYPACKSKCEPILKFMMQGLNVENNPIYEKYLFEGDIIESHECCVTIKYSEELEVVFEDEWIAVVNKPAGMLSVPGKSDLDSVYSLMKRCYPYASGPLIVHRLDMDTSGLMVIAKTKDIHKCMQRLFASGKVEKCYFAILDGIVSSDEGEISLPICPDHEDRPRQMVSCKYGKPSVTRYKVSGRTDKYTQMFFYPLTGRTHQLRVHSAHPQGLNIPIKGDRLYGQPSDRLYLHSMSLRFVHPVTDKEFHINTPF